MKNPGATVPTDLVGIGGPALLILVALSVIALIILLAKLYQFARLRLNAREPVASARARPSAHADSHRHANKFSLLQWLVNAVSRIQIKIGTRFMAANTLIIGLSVAILGPFLVDNDFGILMMLSLFMGVVSLTLIPILLPWICTHDLNQIQAVINDLKNGNYNTALSIVPEPTDPNDEYELNLLKREIHWMQRAIAMREQSIRRQAERIASLNEALRIEAITDKLTGLYNARHFWESISKCFNRHLDTGEPFTFVILDIDFFKRINDTYGHPGGDRVLQQIARRLREISREHDLVARIGGEEFALILRNLSLSDIPSYLNRLHRQLREYRIQISPEICIQITVSIGYYVIERQPSSSTNAQTGTTQDIVKRADDALYWFKQNGRDGIKAWHELDISYREQRLKLEMNAPTRVQPCCNSDTS